MDGKAMKLVLSRMVREGVAPTGESAVDYATSTAGILLLTNAALYIANVKSPGGTRLPLDRIGEVQMDRKANSVKVVVRDADGFLFSEVLFPDRHVGWVASMERLAAQAPGLPGLKPPVEMLGVEPLAQTSGALRFLVVGESAPVRCRERAALFATETGLAVATPGRGVAFYGSWMSLTTVATQELDDGLGMALEIANDGGRVGLLTTAFGLSSPTSSDAFFTNELVKAHLTQLRDAPSRNRGAIFLDDMTRGSGI